MSFCRVEKYHKANFFNPRKTQNLLFIQLQKYHFLSKTNFFKRSKNLFNKLKLFKKMALNNIKNVLISDDVSTKCVEILQNNGFNVVKNTSLTLDQLKQEVKVIKMLFIIHFLNKIILLLSILL